ncbi:hypothetical protein HG535_0H00870 [Zygotorulaspora mrakii]|uniref:Uncharacterized protein n=1 Tax=Zygotorulaspora mrakii TaxID=42260 RepID=A0A7H9B7Q4_ZYGMR|nr:uncharacterized protein HG535_0H00870 [Zygotorulaspora mrakii]QLG74761.1 hypothetical protein HG535_0H00870 [Zygotorulaspora mrakii]
MSFVGTGNTFRKSSLTESLKDGSQLLCNRTSSGLTVGDSNLYSVTEVENESPAFPSKQPDNSAKLAALKRRSYAVNALYKNVMNKRNSTGICTIEHNHLSSDLRRHGKTDNGRVRSIASTTSTISLTANSDGQHNPKMRNPIDHYEQNMNFALRPKSSSTADLVATQQLELPVRSQSGLNLRTIPATRSRVGSKLWQSRNFSDNERNEINDDNEEHSSHNKDIISGEIANALSDDIMHAEVSFDNKWVDSATLDNFADHVSQTSSNQSPRTKEPTHRRNSSNISRRDSIILEDFERDLNQTNSKATGGSEEKILKNSSRLQLKLNTMKMKYDNFNDEWSSSTVTVSNQSPNETDDSKMTKVQMKYWSTNIDVKTKILSEKISRELQSVRRTAIDDSIASGKLLSTRLKLIVKEKYHRDQKVDLITNVIPPSPPVLRTVNSLHSDVLFSKLFESTKKGAKEDDPFHEKISQTLSDDDLKESLFSGRAYTRKMWLEIENIEFT